MRGFWLSLLLWIGADALAIAGFFAYFHYRHGVGMVDALKAAFFGALILLFALYLVAAAARAFSDRAALRRTLAGEPPRDGKKALLVGTMKPLTQERVISPLDSSSCLAYQYRVSGIEGSGKRRREVLYYRGSAIAPSVVATTTGNYSLLAVPDFDGPDPLVRAKTARPKMERYLQKTAFLPHRNGGAEMTDRWTDADGSHRADVSYVGESPIDLEGATFRQHKLEPGDPVCVIGHYAEGRGIVPHANWTRRTRILAGDADEVARRLSAQIRNCLLLALLVATAAAVLVLVVPG